MKVLYKLYALKLYTYTMKILMINKFFYRKGGSESYMFDLIDLLKKQGHQVIEFSMQDKKNQESEYSNYFVKNIDFSKKEGIFKDIKKALRAIYSFEAKKKLEKLIKKEKPDIAHLHNFNFHLTPSILSVLKKHNIPTVWTLHDYKLICPNYRLFTQGKICERCKVYKYYNCLRYNCFNNFGRSLTATLEMFLHKLILRSYDKVDIFIAPSKFLEAKLKDWNIRPEKIRQLYNFIDLAKFEPNFEPGQGLIYFGRLSLEKGILTLLKAFKGLSGFNLQIVGQGPQKEAIEQYIKENNLNNVSLSGYKKGQELYDLIKKSRLVIAPSQWYENNPISVLEAFALAKPAIGSGLGGIPELVKHGKTGFLFEAGQAEDLKEEIKANYAATELIQQMGQKARNFVEENCSPAIHYENLIKIYKKLIK